MIQSFGANATGTQKLHYNMHHSEIPVPFLSGRDDNDGYNDCNDNDDDKKQKKKHNNDSNAFDSLHMCVCQVFVLIAALCVIN